MAGWRRELAAAVRSLGRGGSGVAVAVASLAVGMGLAVAAFTLLNAMILREMPGVADQDGLSVLAMAEEVEGRPGYPGRFAFPDLAVLRSAGIDFAGLAAAGMAEVAVSLGGEPRVAGAELVTADYFQVLGARPLLGRTPAPGDATQPLAYLSHRFWTERLAAEPDVLGRELRVNGRVFTVVGVAPPGFTGMIPGDVTHPDGGGPDLWLPLDHASLLGLHMGASDPLASLEATWLRVVVRRPGGMTPEALSARLPTLAAALRSAHPEARARVGILAGDVVFGPGAGPLRGSLTIVGFMVLPVLVLLVACANAAALLMARGTARRREMGVRAALGGSRLHLLRPLLLEGVLVALVAAGLALVVALWAGRLAAFFSAHLLVPAPLDGRVLAFTLSVGCATGLLAALAPALRAARTPPGEALGGTGAAGAASGGRARRVLVVAQVALSFMLVVTAGLFARAASAGLEAPTGFREEGLLVVTVDPGLLSAGRAAGEPLLPRLATAMRRLPGVDAVGVATEAPLQGVPRTVVRAQASGRAARVGTLHIDEGYLAATGLPLEAGRGFVADDRVPWPPPAVLVNRTAAAALAPDAPGPGWTVALGEGPEAPTARVVGIVADAGVRLGDAAEPLVYVPMAREYAGRSVLLVHGSGGGVALAEAVRAAARRVEPELPLSAVRSMAALRGEALLPLRLTARGVGALGLVALALAVTGLYGLVAYGVARRRRELGVRMALGASPARLVAGVVAGSLRVALVGMLVGGAAAGGLAVLIRRALFGVHPLDPPAFLGIGAGLVATAVLAALVPAARVTRLEATEALRE